ncbi:MAG TPA: lipid-A-disaccharide synthase [Methyloceanibacter sp.]
MPSQRTSTPASGPLKLFLIAGEHSGDALGAKLIEGLRAQSTRPLELQGVGGELMAEQGCPSLFPLSELAVMSLVDVLPRLPNIWRRIRQSVDAVIAQSPDALVILDSPEFTHQVAKRVRRRAPDIPIIDYVSPSVWAWRPGRARKMRRYIDHILAILPFEPDAHRRLGGPACSYVGHPLVEKLDWMRNLDAEALRGRLGIAKNRVVLVVLPGSRASEVKRLMAPFGDAVRQLKAEAGPFEVILPAVRSVRPLIEEGLKGWSMTPHIVIGEADKFAAFKLARAALAASGTVTLELALAGTPMVVAYRADPIASSLRFLLIAHSVVLPNLILGENVFPELLNRECDGERLSEALLPLMRGGPERERQLSGLARVGEQVRQTDDAPSARAARIVLAYAERRQAELSEAQRSSMGT